MRVVGLLFTAVAGSLAGVQRLAPRLPGNWRVLPDGVEDDHVVTFQISLKQQGLADLRRVALSVSDPADPSYGKHLAAPAARALAAPDITHVQTVERWLQDAALAFTKPGGEELFEVSASAADVAALLHTSFQRVEDKSGRSIVRATDLSLASDVHDAVMALYGLHGLPLPLPEPALQAIDEQPVNVTPALIRDTYGIAGVVPSGRKGNRQAVAEFQGQTMNETALNEFFRRYSPDMEDARVYKYVGDNATPTDQDGIEAMLDIEYIMGVAPGVLTEFWYWESRDFCSDLKNWTSTLLAMEDAPLVHSISYGFQGDLARTGCDSGVIQDIDTAFAKIAARGISLIFASGDAGSGYDSCDASGQQAGLAVNGTKRWGRYPVDSVSACCALAKQTGSAFTFYPQVDPNPLAACQMYSEVDSLVPSDGVTSGGAGVDPSVPTLYPSWPSSSPWVTAVGSTRFIDQRVGQPEQATDLFGSGGGFSSQFDAFEAQRDATSAYLANAPQLPPAGSFPTTGRGTPDVSALGECYRVVAHGKEGCVSGTSASTPAFAAIISLLNEARLNQNMPPMGYLNPWMYANKAAFTDITEGDNYIGQGALLPFGFNCTEGWDPVTGLGTPRFEQMLKSALSNGSSMLV